MRRSGLLSLRRFSLSLEQRMIGLAPQLRWSVRLLAVIGVIAAARPLQAQSRAARTDISFTTPSPDRKWFLRTPAADRGSIEDYGKPHIYLGGVQVDTRANRARSLTTSTRNGIVLVDP